MYKCTYTRKYTNHRYCVRATINRDYKENNNVCSGCYWFRLFKKTRFNVWWGDLLLSTIPFVLTPNMTHQKQTRLLAVAGLPVFQTPACGTLGIIHLFLNPCVMVCSHIKFCENNVCKTNTPRTKFSTGNTRRACECGKARKEEECSVSNSQCWANDMRRTWHATQQHNHNLTYMLEEIAACLFKSKPKTCH